MFGNEGEGVSADDLKDEKSVEDISEQMDRDAADVLREAVDGAEEVDDEFTDEEAGEALAPADLNGLEQFVEYVARNLVDNQDAVSVSTVEKGRVSVIQIRCEKKDIGKIIGKTGKTIAAIRLLVSGAGGRMGLRVTVDVLD